jgi:hypothetical protein
VGLSLQGRIALHPSRLERLPEQGDAGLGLALCEAHLGQGDLHRNQIVEILGWFEEPLGGLKHRGGLMELGLSPQGPSKRQQEGGLVLGQ